MGNARTAGVNLGLRLESPRERRRDNCPLRPSIVDISPPRPASTHLLAGSEPVAPAPHRRIFVRTTDRLSPASRGTRSSTLSPTCLRRFPRIQTVSPDRYPGQILRTTVRFPFARTVRQLDGARPSEGSDDLISRVSAAFSSALDSPLPDHSRLRRGCDTHTVPAGSPAGTVDPGVARLSEIIWCSQTYEH